MVVALVFDNIEGSKTLSYPSYMARPRLWLLLRGVGVCYDVLADSFEGCDDGTILEVPLFLEERSKVCR